MARMPRMARTPRMARWLAVLDWVSRYRDSPLLFAHLTSLRRNDKERAT